MALRGWFPTACRSPASLAISAGSERQSGATYAGARDSGDDLGSFTGLFDDDLAGGADALGKAIETAAVSLRYDSEEKSDGEMAN